MPRSPRAAAVPAPAPVASATAHQILEATLALFKARGLAGVSTRDVAAATGLSRSHLYYYFGNWERLRNAVFEHFAAAELDAAERALAAVPPPEALQALLHESLPDQRDATWVLWLHAGDEALRDEAFAPVYLGIMRRWEGLLAAVVQRGVAEGVWQCDDAAQAARQLFALANGYAMHLLVQPSRAAAAKALEDVMAVARGLLLPVRGPSNGKRRPG
jgi:AcrR family transcriptional regulator